MFLRQIVTFYGLPLGGGSPPSDNPVTDGSDMPYGHMMHDSKNEESAPRQERSFDSANWKPD